MGACDIGMQFNGIVSDVLVRREVERRARRDREVNGHRDGYSGDWQCVVDIKRIAGFFKSRDAALEYLHKNAEKRGPALVVQYLTNDLNLPTVRTIVFAVVPC